MTEDVTEIFALLIERKDEGPMIWETMAANTSLDKVTEAYKRELLNPLCIRAAIVRLERHRGSEALIHAIKGMQE